LRTTSDEQPGSEAAGSTDEREEEESVDSRLLPKRSLRIGGVGKNLELAATEASIPQCISCSDGRVEIAVQSENLTDRHRCLAFSRLPTGLELPYDRVEDTLTHSELLGEVLPFLLLPHGDRWEDLGEDEEQEADQCERAEHDTDLDDRGPVPIPIECQLVLAHETWFDEPVALGPHPHVDEDRRPEHDLHIAAEALEGPDGNRNEVAEDEDECCHDIEWPFEEAEVHDFEFARFLRINREENVEKEEPEPASRDGEEQPTDGVEVFQSDVVVEAEQPAHQGHERDDRRNTRVNGADHEVRCEDGRVPGRNEADCEVPRNDRVNGHEHRENQAGEEESGDRLHLPLALIASPAEREDRVEGVSPTSRAVARERHIRDHGGVEEKDASREVGQDSAGVPHERTADIRPQIAPKVVREDPVERPPGATGVDDRVQHCGHETEDRHHFSSTSDGPPPFGLGESEDRRDHDASVTDTDPEDEVDDHEAPHVGALETSNPETPVEHPADCKDEDSENCTEADEADPHQRSRRNQWPDEFSRNLLFTEPMPLLHRLPPASQSIRVD